MPGDPERSRYEVAVVGRALDLLVDLAAGGAHSAASAAKVIGTSRATAYRLLVTLESRGFAAHDAERGWILGPSFLSVNATSRRELLRAASIPVLTRLRDRELETVNLAEYANGEIVYVDVLESPLRFRMSGERGERAPLHATALGRAVLASLPEAQRETIVGHLALDRLTERTIVDDASLRREIQATTARGWGEEHGETEIGVTCFGAAIHGFDSLPLGAISISVPDARLDEERQQRLGRAISAAAAEISGALQPSDDELIA